MQGKREEAEEERKMIREQHKINYESS